MNNPAVRNSVADYTATAFTDAILWLPELIRSSLGSGSNLIQGRTFTNCLLQGPAVLLALQGVEFDGCNMGYDGGDVRNLVLRPAGPSQVIGAIPFQNCRFKDSDFFAVGFTGAEPFLQMILDLPVDGRP